jgi:hypothetical protein
MRFLRLSPRLGSALLVIGGCTTLQSVPPAELRPPNPPSIVWVTRADHSTVVFHSARVRGDSLFGLVDGEPQRIPLSDATAIQSRETSPARTLALMGALAGGVAVAAYFLVFKPSEDPGCSTGGSSSMVPCPSGTGCCPSGTP